MDFLARVTIYISLAMGICIFTLFSLLVIPHVIEQYQDIWEDYQRSLEPDLLVDVDTCQDNEIYKSGICMTLDVFGKSQEVNNIEYEIPLDCTVDMIDHLVQHSTIFQDTDYYGMNEVGLPEGMEQKDFDICYNEIIELKILSSCTVDMIAHLVEYSSVFDDGTGFILDIGLPPGMTQKEFNVCHNDIINAMNSSQSK